MKFGANLAAHLTPEWRSQYIDYELLKNMLYDCKEELPNAEEGEEEIVQRHIGRFEETFFAECDIQLCKVNTFFAEKINEATRRFVMLKSELQAYKDSMHATEKQATQSSSRNLTKRRSAMFGALPLGKKKRHKTIRDMKLAFTEFYLSLVLLQNYQELNFTGFRKILKKHDKMLATEKGATWRKCYVETAPFHTDNRISEYILKTENSYIEDLENGDRSKAMKRLRVPPLTETRTYPKGTVFRVGLFLGMFIVLLGVAIMSGVRLKANNNMESNFWDLVRFYRAGFIVPLYVACLGLNIWAWRTAGVNHVLIFEIDPRQHLSHQHFFEIATLFAILSASSVIAFLFSHVSPLGDWFPPYCVHPAFVYAIYVIFLFNPFPILYSKARFWLVRRLGRLVACGFYPVEFADFWLADQLNSLVVVLQDAEFLICFYITQTPPISFGNEDNGGCIDHYNNDEPDHYCGASWWWLHALVACYPAWIRFVQCVRRYKDTKKWFPHLANAIKYATTFFKVLFGTVYYIHSRHEQQLEQKSVYFYLWVASLFVSTIYTIAWDIKMDWGFLDSNAGDNKFLREEIVYPNKSIYYFAIVEDVIIRSSWIVTVVLAQQKEMQIAGKIASNVLALLEVWRRIVWNFFRLENEHLNNCGEFRAVRDISVAPFRQDDLSNLEKMMDEADGAESILLLHHSKSRHNGSVVGRTSSTTKLRRLSRSKLRDFMTLQGRPSSTWFLEMRRGAWFLPQRLFSLSVKSDVSPSPADVAMEEQQPSCSVDNEIAASSNA